MQCSHIIGGGGSQNLVVLLHTWFFMQPLTFNWSEAIYSVVFCFCFVFMCTCVDMYEDTFVSMHACMCLHVQARGQPQMFLRHRPPFSLDIGSLIGLELACKLSWVDSKPHLSAHPHCLSSRITTACYLTWLLLLCKHGLWEGLCVVGWFSSAGDGPRGLVCAAEVHFYSPL